jgi:GMP synthase (glutamine-hydrolysing)
MKILLFDNGTKYLPELNKLLKEIGEIIVTKNTDDLFSKEVDLVVLSGGHHHYINKNPEAYQEEIRFIKNSNKPIIGICLGAELIAYAFGGKLDFLKIRNKGIYKIEVLEKNYMFGNINKFNVYKNHRLAITSLSKNLIGLAKSKSGFEVIKHKNKPTYGFQFHPEMFESKTYGDEVFENLFNYLNKIKF